MSKAYGSFQLRPAKYIDRSLFTEFLNLVSGSMRPSSEYTYMSMGGTFLVDHHMVYRKTCIGRFVSFDNVEQTVERQKFNVPGGDVRCLFMDAGDFASQLNDYRETQNVALWLDFMDLKYFPQFQTVEEALVGFQPGDILRVTLKADYKKLARDLLHKKGRVNGRRKVSNDKKLEILQDHIGRYCSSENIDICEKNWPGFLIKCFEIAAASAARRNRNCDFHPVFTTQYDDGTIMLAITCMAVESGGHIPAQVTSWDHAVNSYSDVLEISVADLSRREREFIDQRVSLAPSQILRAVNFLPDNEPDVPAATSEVHQTSLALVRSYRDLHRYYPAFHHVEPG